MVRVEDHSVQEAATGVGMQFTKYEVLSTATQHEQSSCTSLVADPLGLDCKPGDTSPGCPSGYGPDGTPIYQGGTGGSGSAIEPSNLSSFYYWLMYYSNYFYDPPNIDWGGSSTGGGTTPPPPPKPAANNGFTLGIRAPGQTWKQCMAANANTYSIGGATELTVNVATGTNSNISEKTSIVTGNGITDLFFSGPGAGDFLTAASAGAGSPLTVGRRTSDIMSLNLAGKGGLPQALGSTGAKGFFETAGKWLNLGLDEAEKFAVDAGLAGAESINCAIPRVP